VLKVELPEGMQKEDLDMGILSRIRDSASAVASYFMLPGRLNDRLEERQDGDVKREHGSVRKVSFDELTESVIKGSTRTRAGYSRKFCDFI